MSDHYYLHSVCREDAEANAKRAEFAEQNLAVVRDQRDKAEAIASESGEALDKTECRLRVERQEAAVAIRVLREAGDEYAKRAELAEQKLADVSRRLHTVTEERNRLQVSEREACALDALGVAQRRHDATDKKIKDLLVHVGVLQADRTALAVEVAYLRQHPLLIADSGSTS